MSKNFHSPAIKVKEWPPNCAKCPGPVHAMLEYDTGKEMTFRICIMCSQHYEQDAVSVHPCVS